MNKEDKILEVLKNQKKNVTCMESGLILGHRQSLNGKAWKIVSCSRGGASHEVGPSQEAGVSLSPSFYMVPSRSPRQGREAWESAGLEHLDMFL